jgi:hypothetical protein
MDSKAKQKLYYLENRDEIKKKSLEYYYKNKNKIRERVNKKANDIKLYQRDYWYNKLKHKRLLQQPVVCNFSNRSNNNIVSFD